jgi:peptidoglycan/LPS O-acetylase OafA/YrhL
VLRGVASLAVLFWHWPHFFYAGTRPERVAAEKLPLYDFLYPLYLQGGLGVDIFFCLSGFIFYWLYADALGGKAVSGREFFVLRFSRLYPLHLVTLLAVAAGQDLYLRMTGGYFVYSHNDAYHFLLNLLFAPAWDFEAGFSFNAPVWSVSVEVALYVFFFALCRLLPVWAPVLLGVAAAGLFVVEPHYLPLGRGIAAFFIGGTVYLVYRRIVASGYVAALARWLPWLLGVLWLLGLVALSLPQGVGPAWPNRMPHLYTTLVLFPLTILTLAVVETRRGPLMRGAAFLGDVSYSSYLLHFPLQLAAAGAAIALGLDRSVFSSAWTLAAFIAVLLALSFASYRFLELPAQRALRRRV